MQMPGCDNLTLRYRTWWRHGMKTLSAFLAVLWALRWRQNGRDSVLNHQPHDCLLNRLFRRRSKKTSKLRVTGLCAGNSPGTGEFPAQMASYAENVFIWWRHHEGILSLRGMRNFVVFLVVILKNCWTNSLIVGDLRQYDAHTMITSL